jgi:hypothetical protein
MMHSDTFGGGQRIAQLEESYIRVLGQQFLKEPLMSRKLAGPRGPSHRRKTGFTRAPDLTGPPAARRSRNLQATRCFSA